MWLDSASDDFGREVAMKNAWDNKDDALRAVIAAFSYLGSAVRIDVAAMLAGLDPKECDGILRDMPHLAEHPEPGSFYWWGAKAFMEKRYPGEKRAHLYAEVVRRLKQSIWQDLVKVVVFSLVMRRDVEVLQNERFKNALYGTA
jgi:hypothetical protein